MGKFDEQSQRWILNELRWGAFGAVAGLLGSISISLEFVYEVTFALSLLPGARFVLPLYTWLSANGIRFLPFLGISVASLAISLLEPRVLISKLRPTLWSNVKRDKPIILMLRVRNVFAIYIGCIASFCVVMFAVLSIFIQSIPP
jgi:hypothetical protein